MKVLVVDDNPVVRKLIQKELERGGYEVVTAESGFEALVAACTEPKPNFMTLDVEMKGLDGFETCKKLRESPYCEHFVDFPNKQLPVLFISGDDTVEARQKGFELGALDYLQKPYEAGSVLAAVNKILKPEAEFDGLTALVVDDSKMIRMVVGSALRQMGIKVIEAGDGTEAIPLAEEFGQDIDLVITDYVMPEMNGDKLCVHLRKQPKLKDVPIIFLTSLTQNENILNGFRAGANDYLTKPFVKEELECRVRVQLKNRLLVNKLAREAEKTKMILKGAGEAILGLDKNGRIIFANPAAGELLGGIRFDEMSEQCFYRMVTLSSNELDIDGEQSKCESFCQNLCEQSTCRGEEELILPDDSRLPIEFVSRQIVENGEVKIIILVIKDISQRKKMEELKDDVSRISRHDLKTPLNGIINLPQFIKGNPALSEEEHEFLDLITQSGYRMLNMINQSLDLYKMEIGTYKYTAEDVKLESVIKRVKIDLDAEAQVGKNSINIINEAGDSDSEIIVRADEALSYSVLANLIKNALEASPPDSPVTVKINIEPDNCVVVHNMGVVPEKIRATFFKKYATSGKKGGTGLGTYSANLIAKTQGWNLSMVTDEEAGTSLTIHLASS
jgi:PAS domain S-box-containing protein